MIFSRHEVKGKSMKPTLNEGDRLLVLRFGKINENDLVIAEKNGKEIVKRVMKKNGKEYFVQGDNFGKSTDSRHFGALKKNNILGKVIFKY